MSYKKNKYVCEYCGKDCGNPPALKMHLDFCKIKKEKEGRRKKWIKHGDVINVEI